MVTTLRCPNTSEPRRFTSASITISSVPMTMRMVSGRKRMRSVVLMLTGIGGLHAHGRLHPERDVHLGLRQNALVHLSHRRQEALRVHAHPHHHGDKWNHHGPLAAV